MATEFVLGPSLDAVFEPFPVAPVPVTEGRRGVGFDTPPTSPGGNAHLVLLSAAKPDDVLPINVYVFFVHPASGVPVLADRTPDWFFKSGAASSSLHVGAADANGKLTVTVPGVKPSLDPYFVQVVLEYTKA